MNSVVPISHLTSLVPTNMSEAMRLAEMMATAKLVPAGLQKSPADCLMVIQQAIRWDMDPFAVAQECSVIQGKLMHSGKLVAAVVNARGGLIDRLSYSYEGEGQHRSIKVSGRLQGELAPREVSVSLANAKTNNKVWQTQPDQQLMYHGVRVWARRHTPELMLGVYSPEEFDEPAKQPPKPAPNVLLHDPTTGEITDPPAVSHAEESAAGAFADERSPGADAAPSSVQEQSGGAALSLEEMARNAAGRGEAIFRTFWRNRTGVEQMQLNKLGDELRELMTEAKRKEEEKVYGNEGG